MRVSVLLCAAEERVSAAALRQIWDFCHPVKICESQALRKCKLIITAFNQEKCIVGRTVCGEPVSFNLSASRCISAGHLMAYVWCVYRVWFFSLAGNYKFTTFYLHVLTFYERFKWSGRLILSMHLTLKGNYVESESFIKAECIWNKSHSLMPVMENNSMWALFSVHSLGLIDVFLCACIHVCVCAHVWKHRRLRRIESWWTWISSHKFKL